MKSRKKLKETLDRLEAKLKTNADIKVQYRGMSFETYGKETFAYVHLESVNERRRLEMLLSLENWNVNMDYSPGNPFIEVRVSYFKAFGWDK